MDGAGELYLGYRFDHLESYEYEVQSEKNILVELYFMKTADDAFGLLSLDWGGEPVDLGQTLEENVKVIRIWFSAALAAGASLSRLSHQSSRGSINHDAKSCQGRLERSRKCSLNRLKR